jgi:glutamate-ammonia-ligase adenylyltransferase
MLINICGFSRFLAELMIRHPYHLEWLREDDRLNQPVKLDQVGDGFRRIRSDHPDYDSRRITSIQYMRSELLRISVRRMLDRAHEQEMMLKLSELADGCIRHALDEVLPVLVKRHGIPVNGETVEDPGHFPIDPRPTEFAVLALGRLGARGLNYSSDVDLIFIYSSEGRTCGREDGSGRITNHVFHNLLAKNMVEYLSGSTEAGYFYRVDTRLRPDGESGALTRSMTGYEIYYSTQAYLWERMALLRARPVAGSEPLAEAFIRMVRPLVFDPLHGDELIREFLHERLSLVLRKNRELFEKYFKA